MKNKTWVKLDRIRGYLVLFGCVVLSSFLVLIFLTYSVGASAQAAGQRGDYIRAANSPQKTINIEFIYKGEETQSAAIAADNFAKLLAKETGLDIHASINPCEAKIVRNLGANTTDIAPLGSVAYVQGNETYGMKARLVNGQRGAFEYRGQINVQASGGYTDIWGLQGTRFAATAPTSQSSYMLPYMLISETTGMSMTEFFSEIQFVGGHTQVIKDIYNGLAECGGSFEGARAAVAGEYPDVNDVVHVLTYTEYIPLNPWVFRTGLTNTDVQKLSDGIIAVAGTPDGEKALEVLFGSNHSGIETVNDSEYDISRNLVKTFGLRMDNCHDMFLPFVSRKTSQ